MVPWNNYLPIRYLLREYYVFLLIEKDQCIVELVDVRHRLCLKIRSSGPLLNWGDELFLKVFYVIEHCSLVLLLRLTLIEVIIIILRLRVSRFSYDQTINRGLVSLVGWSTPSHCLVVVLLRLPADDAALALSIRALSASIWGVHLSFYRALPFKGLNIEGILDDLTCDPFPRFGILVCYWICWSILFQMRIVRCNAWSSDFRLTSLKVDLGFIGDDSGCSGANES